MLFLLILVFLPISLVEAISQCLSRTSISSFIFWRAMCLGTERSKWCLNCLWNKYDALPTIPLVTDHRKLNLVNTILSCNCTRFKTFVVVSDVCKASRLIWGKLRKVVTKISFGVFCHKDIFTQQKIHVPSSIKQKIQHKIQNWKVINFVAFKTSWFLVFLKFLSFSQIIPFF